MSVPCRRGRFLNSEQFVEAIAPKGDLSKIGRSQFATLFRVADANKRGLLSWDDFVVFETILKRPDADYWIAFQYFDVYAHHPILPCASNIMQTKGVPVLRVVLQRRVGHHLVR